MIYNNKVFAVPRPQKYVLFPRDSSGGIGLCNTGGVSGKRRRDAADRAAWLAILLPDTHPKFAAGCVNKTSNAHFCTEQQHLNFADVARHHVLQDACSPARRFPEAHKPTASHARNTSPRRKSEHETHSLGWPKRDLHAADGWRGLMKRGAWRSTAAREAQRGLDEYERDVDLKALRNGNVQDFAQEEIAIWHPA